MAALVVASPATTHGVGALRWHLHQLKLRVAERAQAAAIDTACVQIQRAVDPDRLRHDLVAINDAWRCLAAGRRTSASIHYGIGASPLSRIAPEK